MDDRSGAVSLSETRDEAIRQTVRILSVIVMALVSGQVVFAGVVIFALDTWNKPATGMLMAGLGVAFAIQMFAMAIFVPSFAEKNGVKRAAGDVGLLLGVFRVRTILGAAFVEGAGMLNLVAYMLEHNKWSLAPVVAGLLFLLTMIPSDMKLTRWIDETQRSPLQE